VLCLQCYFLRLWCIYFPTQRKLVLEFPNSSLASPSSSPCPELCWGSESWGWRALSGSGRREIPSMRSSTPSRISLAHSWKEQAYKHAAQQKKKATTKQWISGFARWVCTLYSHRPWHSFFDKIGCFSSFQHSPLCHFWVPCLLTKSLNWHIQSQ